MFKQTTWEKTLIFEQSNPGRIGHQVDELSEKEKSLLNRAKQKITPGAFTLFLFKLTIL